jgi:putative transposase
MREIRTLRATWRGLETWRVKCFDLSRAPVLDPTCERPGVKFLRSTHPYIKVHGQWRYLYRAIDRSGALVDVLFREHRDMDAAKAFFRSAKTVTDVTPDRVTTDGHDSYPRAIRTTLGEGVKHRTSRYLNNRLEQDHRGIKGRYQPMRGFKCP